MHYIVEGFRAKLVSISMELSDENLDKMKFVIEGLNGDLQSVKIPIHLFHRMMQHEMLSETKLDPLAKLLRDAKRKDLATKVQQMKGKQQ